MPFEEAICKLLHEELDSGVGSSTDLTVVKSSWLSSEKVNDAFPPVARVAG
jgi:hypothetical protein